MTTVQQLPPHSDSGPDGSTTGELVARARELAPLLSRNAAQGEQDRRVATESIEALDEAGLFKIAVPRRYGGHECGMRTMLDVSAAVAEADGGTAWVVTLINAAAWLVGLYPERAQDDIFGADPEAKIAGVLAPTAQARRVEGGYRVTGRWYYNSGSWLATWMILGIPVTDDSGQVVDQGLALVPAEQCTTEDTWFVAGMKSTASNCLIVDDVFVPDHRIMSVPAAIEGRYPTERTEEAFYRSAFGPSLALVVIGPQLGMGRAALKLVTDKAGRKPISYTFFDKQTDSVAFQLQVAEAAMKIDMAHLLAYRAADEIDRDARSREAGGGYPAFRDRARVRADSGAVAALINEAINTLLYAHGAGSFADVNPLQRIWRDAAVAARHAGIAPAVGYEAYGKALLGIEEKITPLI